MESPPRALIDAFVRGFLVGLRGPDRGKVFPLGDEGLLLDSSLTWLPRRTAVTACVAELYREGESARLNRLAGEIRAAGQWVEAPASLACNASLETQSGLYRLLYLPANWRQAKEEEAARRSLPSRESLLQPDQRLPVGFLDMAGGPLPPGVQSFIDARWGWPWGGMRDYIHEFVKSPLVLIRAQNQRLGAIPDQGDRRRLARDFILFNASLESALFYRGQDKTRETYNELTNVLYFAQGDYLPGHRFVLGQESTYDRERLYIDKTAETISEEGKGQNLLDFLVESRLAAVAHAGDPFVPGLGLFFELAEETPPADRVRKYETTTLALQDFFGHGGVCRHQCAILQVALQEAGIPSRYMRGKLFLGGYHAWNEVDILGDGSYFLILDPYRCQILFKTGTLETTQGRLYLRDEGYPVTQDFNTIWRGKLRGNGGSEE
jgi:hypothetical protein